MHAESPFEFRALEVFLEAICSFHAARATEIEIDAYPALDKLTSKVLIFIGDYYMIIFLFPYVQSYHFAVSLIEGHMKHAVKLAVSIFPCLVSHINEFWNLN